MAGTRSEPQAVPRVPCRVLPADVELTVTLLLSDPQGAARC